MLRFVALALALLAPAAFPAAALGPLAAPGELVVEGAAYTATLTWPAPLTSADPAATLRLDAGGREGTMVFEAIVRSDVFLAADTTARPLLVGALVADGATPQVTLTYDLAGTGAVQDTTSTLAFTFHPDRIEYATSLRVPSGAFSPYFELATTLAWADAWDARGVILPDGATIEDGGVALDPYQVWESTERYGTYVEGTAAPGAVAQVRLAQGSFVNYLADGQWRATTTQLRSSTVFNAFLDFPTVGVVQGLWVRDALLVAPDTASAAAAFVELAVSDPMPSRASQDEQVVIALADTGINPYHVAFRDDSPLGHQHPSTYLDGYPADAQAVHLTLDAADLETALAADDALWKSLEPDTLYWFPGTKIVGAISADAGNETPGLIFSTGHGTMTASRAAANEYSLCPECRIVAMQAGDLLDGGGAQYVRWAADQPWIDIQSHSWSGAVPFNNDVEVPGIRSASEHAAGQMPFFASAGNGASGKAGVLGHPAFTRPMSGAQGVVPVGGHDNGYVTAWTAQYPYVVADACASWAAVGTTMDVFDPAEGGGTSAATPYTAGEAGRVILEARRVLGAPGDRLSGVLAQGAPRPDLGASPLADGDLTLDELKSVLFRTATARPSFTRDDGVTCSDPLSTPSNTLPVKWTEYPSDLSAYPFIGWGGIDVTSLARALAVLHGAPMPDRPLDEQAHADAEALRGAYWSVEPPALGASSVPQDDAGSGGDAPSGEQLAHAILIESGVVYDGLLLGTYADEVDVYRFEGRAGSDVDVRVRGTLSCVSVYSPAGEPLANATCSLPVVAELTGKTLRVRLLDDGTHYIRIEAVNPTPYRFSFGIDDEPAPEPSALPIGEILEPDDAGSGGDAPSTTRGAPVVAPGVVHKASLGPRQVVDTDVYSFGAAAGQVVTVHPRGAFVCVDVLDRAGGSVLAGACNYAGIDSDGIMGDLVQATLPADGAYFLRFTGASRYAFSFGLDAAPAETGSPVSLAWVP